MTTSPTEPNWNPMQPPKRAVTKTDTEGITWIPLDGGGWLRVDSQGRLLCKARRKNGKERCNNPTVTGLRVCRMHGALAPRAQRAAKEKLAALVDPATRVLEDILNASGTDDDVPKDADRLRAVTIVLDRTGHGATSTVNVADVKEQLYKRLLDKVDGRTYEDDDDREDADEWHE